jgi:serine/threonine protein kinase
MSKGTLYGGRWKTGNGLGEGGQSHVFRAMDTTNQLSGEFALKRVRNPERHERFRNEIDATKMLSHPNIIRLIDHSALLIGYFTSVSLTLAAYDVPSSAIGLKR